MKLLFRSLLRSGCEFYRRLKEPRFYLLKRDARGILPQRVYKKLYQLIFELPDLDIVEVGGAAGAGSVAIAWGMIESGKSSKLIVIEKCEGGTRSEFGGYQNNLDCILSNFRRFGINEKVVLFPKELTTENGAEVVSLIRTGEISALVHDADGRIDRDFFLFWPVLRPGGLIVIDDYANRNNFKEITAKYPQGGIKSLMTFRLLNQFMEWGLFETTAKLGDTVFGRKPHDADFKNFDLTRCKEIIDAVKQERIVALGHQ